MNSKKAEIGVGTLIIFIAMILVAAIAASVLIQTAVSLQNRALLTGGRATEAVSTGLEALVIYGTDGSDGQIERFYMKLKPVAGSDTIRFNDTMAELMTMNDSLSLRFGGVGCDANLGTNLTHYFVDHLVSSSGSRPGYLQRGDVAMLCLNAPYPITPNEDLTFGLVSTTGFPLTIETVVPDVIHTNRVFIYP